MLQGNAGSGGNTINQRDELAVGQRARIVEEDARAAAKHGLRLLGIATDTIACNAALDGDADVGLDQVGRRSRPAQADLLLYGRSDE